MSRTFVVQITVESSHEYMIAADSKERALEIAAAHFQMGNRGIQVGYEILDGFAEPEEEE